MFTYASLTAQIGELPSSFPFLGEASVSSHKKMAHITAAAASESICITLLSPIRIKIHPPRIAPTMPTHTAHAVLRILGTRRPTI